MKKRYKTELPDALKWPEDESFKWFAINATGYGYFYSEMPSPDAFGAGYWITKDHSSGLRVGYFPHLIDGWTESLVKRA